MDVSNFDLQGLQLLHTSLLSVLKSHEVYLEERRVTGEIPKNEEQAVLYKIGYYKDVIQEIESRINELNSEKLRFSVEYIFCYFGLPKRTIQIEFITTSEAFTKYGPYVTGVAIFEEEEIPVLMESVKDLRNSDGRIRFQELESSDMSNELKEELKANGFMTSEIDTIRWV